MKKLIFVVLMVFALSAVYDIGFSEENPEQRLEYITALKYYNSQKYKEAVEVLEEHVKKTPSAVDYYLLGYALYELKRFDESNEAFKQAYLLDPEFSLEKAGLLKEMPEGKPMKPRKKIAVLKQPKAKKKPEAEKKPSVEAQPQKPAQMTVMPEKKALAAPPVQQKVEPIKPMQPVSKIESLFSFLKFKKEPPFVATEVLIALGAVLGIIVLAVGFILYRKKRSKSNLPPAE